MSVLSPAPAASGLLCTFLLATLLPAQGSEPEAVDEAAVAFFREHGLEKSQVMDHLSWMCDVYGPRLTGSPNLRKAQEWAQRTFQSWGLANVHTERWGPFGRGWRCDRAVMEVVGDNPWPVIVYPKAWSPSIARVEAEVVLIADMDAEQLEAADLTGKIVLRDSPRELEEPFDGTSRRLDSEDLLVMADQRSAGGQSRERRARGARDRTDFREGFRRRQAVQSILDRKQPLAIVDRGSKGDYGTVFVSGASALRGEDGERTSARDVGAEVVPQWTMAAEHYNRMCRILAKGLPVKVAVELQTTFFGDDLHEYNVLAEIPGTDPELAEQVVMLGAHFDSWHTGTGTTDNGCGSAVVMEAARLIAAWAAMGSGPRRTVRVALWSGEEQGLLGSRAYVREHFGERGEPTGEHARLSGYFNLDNGTGRVRGVYLQGNEAVAPVFRSWLRPFHDLDAATLTLNDTGGTDHLAFDGVGLPGFQFIQDPVSYSTRTHHSNMDLWDHAVATDLQQASTVMASFVWHTAQRDELLPRKPLPAPSEASGRSGG